MKDGFRVTQLYDEIFRALAKNTNILNLLGILPSGDVSQDNLVKASKIQKRRQPMNVVESLPIISYYTPGGTPDRRNNLVYNSTFIFDIYTNDDVELAQEISDTIVDLFDGEIPVFTGVENFETMVVDQFESTTDLVNTYCFTTIMLFSVSLDI